MIEKLIEGIKSFSSDQCQDDSDYNKNVERGQSAKVLIIGCSDSLVDPLSLTGALPGDLFIHRNIAGIVPRSEDMKSAVHATGAVLDYAVNSLDVDDIIVMSHGFCGGVKALIKNRSENKNKSFSSSWMNIVRDDLIKVIEESDGLSEAEQRSLCEKELARVSLSNLETFSFIEQKLKDGNLNLHAWHFDRGILSVYDGIRWVKRVG